jgi:sugar lactone lactonase YvrE
MKILIRLLMGLALLLALVAGILRWQYGGGGEFPDRSTPPLLGPERAETVAELPVPPGNIAVSKTGRVFIAIHPESRPEKLHVAEVVKGTLVPWPDEAAQTTLFRAPQGIRIDRQNRLWTIDHGDHARQRPRLLAFDVDTGQEVHRHDFDDEAAPWLSYLQDLVVAPNGKTVVIADVSFFRKSPALVIYDVPTQKAHRALAGDESVEAQPYLIRSYSGPVTRLGGLISLRAGVDSLGIDDAGQWVYYGAMNHTELYRAKLNDLRELSAANLRLRKQKVGPKVQSDGITLDRAGNVYLTDVEHSAIAIMKPGEPTQTLVKHPKMRWPDGLSWGPDGYLYVADSAIPDIALQSQEHVRQSAPYHLFRVKLDVEARPGH